MVARGKDNQEIIREIHDFLASQLNIFDQISNNKSQTPFHPSQHD